MAVDHDQVVVEEGVDKNSIDAAEAEAEQSAIKAAADSEERAFG